MNVDEDYKTQVDEINAGIINYVENKLMGLIDDDNASSIQFYLRNKAPDYKPSIDVDAKVEGELKVNAIFGNDLLKD
jgi:hypothetical protein